MRQAAARPSLTPLTLDPSLRRRLVEAALAALLAVVLLATVTVVPERFGSQGQGVVVAGALCALLIANTRLEMSLVVLGIYLACLDGPVKLLSSGDAASLGRDVLILAVFIGVLARLIVEQRAFPYIPYLFYVGTFAVIVVAMFFHPDTPGIKGMLAGTRQHLGFVPFLLFGALVARRRDVLFGLTLVIGFAVVTNAVAGLIQFNLTAEQFADWGPGYAERILGDGAFQGSAGVFVDDGGTVRVRPFGLGGDIGAAGVVGWVALPFALALMLSGVRRRPLGLVMLIGTLACVLTSQSRAAVLSTLVALLAFFVIRTRSRNAATSILALGVAAGVAFAFTSAFVASNDAGSLNRLKSVTGSETAKTIQRDRGSSLRAIPQGIVDFPVGVGLARVGPAGGFAGSPAMTNAENQPNFLTSEVGTIGLIAFLALWLRVVFDALRLARNQAMVELEGLWVAVAALLVAMTVAWFQAAVSPGGLLGPLFFFLAGIVGVHSADQRTRDRSVSRATSAAVS